MAFKIIPCLSYGPKNSTVGFVGFNFLLTHSIDCPNID
jgi:hypothetical protein